MQASCRDPSPERQFVNAPFMQNVTAAATSLDPVSAFLKHLSIEVTGKQIDKLPILREKLPRGTRVYVALIDPAELQAQISAVKHLKDAGFTPVPHVPARFV